MFEPIDAVQCSDANAKQENLTFTNLVSTIKPIHAARLKAKNQAFEIEFARTGKEPSDKTLMVRDQNYSKLIKEYKKALLIVQSEHASQYLLQVVNAEISTIQSKHADFSEQKTQTTNRIAELSSEMQTLKQDNEYQRLVSAGDIQAADLHEDNRQAELKRIDQEKRKLSTRLEAINKACQDIQHDSDVHHDIRKAIINGLLEQEYIKREADFWVAFESFKSAYLHLGALTMELEKITPHKSPEYFSKTDQLVNTNHSKEYRSIIENIIDGFNHKTQGVSYESV